MASLDTVRSFLTEEHGLAVVSAVQADGAVLSTVVNCDIFAAAGGDHGDRDTYDQTMRDRARTAVLIAPARIRGNG